MGTLRSVPDPPGGPRSDHSTVDPGAVEEPMRSGPVPPDDVSPDPWSRHVPASPGAGAPLAEAVAGEIQPTAETAARLADLEAAIARLDELTAGLDRDRGRRVEAQIDLLYKILATTSRSALGVTGRLDERLDEIAGLRSRDAASTEAALAELNHEAARTRRCVQLLEDRVERLASEVEQLGRRLEAHANEKQRSGSRKRR